MTNVLVRRGNLDTEHVQKGDHMTTQGEDGHQLNKDRDLKETKAASTLILGF